MRQVVRIASSEANTSFDRTKDIVCISRLAMSQRDSSPAFTIFDFEWGMPMSPLSRQELYQQIKTMGKDKYVLEEMKRLGFWDQNQTQIPDEIINRRAAIQQELRELTQIVKDPHLALKALHQQRMAAARQKRIDTKVKKEVRRYQAACRHHQQKAQSITFLGNATYYPKLPGTQNTELLKTLQIPLIESPLQLAQNMGITLQELRFLTYTQQVSQIKHYQRFEIPKKTGGYRLISAPMPRLKRLQYWILDNILNKLPLSEQAHGFVSHRNIVSNAQLHTQQAVVINFDLKDFFPTIDYKRIRGLFRSLGYNEQIASLLSLVCSEPLTDEVSLDQTQYFLANRQRILPQGAPTSPAMSNLICRKLDRRLQGLAQKWGFVYSRYADDLSFSSATAEHISKLVYQVKKIVAEEGFCIHPDKTRIMRKGSQQEVTGIVVNQKTNLDRRTLKRFRALIFQLKKDGLAGKFWSSQHDASAFKLPNQNQSEQLSHAEIRFLQAIEGYAHFIAQVQPEKAQTFLQDIYAIQKQAGYHRPRYKTAEFRSLSAKGLNPIPKQSIAAIAQAPQLEDIIHHRDVLAEVQAALGISNQAGAQV